MDDPVTPVPEQPSVGPLGEGDRRALLDLDQWAFAYDPDGYDTPDAIAGLEWDRTFGARLPEPDRLAGIYSVYSLELEVPGGRVPSAGLTWVGVHPGDRRRGVLTTMISHHLADVRDTGREPVSALFAAEPPIYGRFGYGLATRAYRFKLGRGAALRPTGPAGVRVRYERADVERHAELVEACYDAARHGRPGWCGRRRGLVRELFNDPKVNRHGAEPLRLAIAESAGPGAEVRGYALFRRKADWGETGANFSVRVSELVARDPAAAAALWSRLTDLDLTTEVHTDPRSLDDPLLHLLVNVPAASPRLDDRLWLRLVDLPAALAARRYQAPVDVVLEVTDTLLPSNGGRWRLTGGPDGARCEATADHADLALDVRELGAVYLGGTPLTGLAGAGLARELRPGTLEAASVAFGWPVVPHSGWTF